MPSRRRGFALGILIVVLVGETLSCSAQPPAGGGKDPKSTPADMQLVERILAARKEYQEALEAVRAHYVSAGDIEGALMMISEIAGGPGAWPKLPATVRQTWRDNAYTLLGQVNE